MRGVIGESPGARYRSKVTIEQGEVETLVGSESHSTGSGFGSGLRFWARDGYGRGVVEALLRPRAAAARTGERLEA